VLDQYEKEKRKSLESGNRERFRGGCASSAAIVGAQAVCRQINEPPEQILRRLAAIRRDERFSDFDRRLNVAGHELELGIGKTHARIFEVAFRREPARFFEGNPRLIEAAAPKSEGSLAREASGKVERHTCISRDIDRFTQHRAPLFEPARRDVGVG
jgi:hypothetical protein